MRLPTRFRVRTLMLVVALVALGFGAAAELRNHAKRDRLLENEAVGYAIAAWQRELAFTCRDSEGKRPYHPAVRMRMFAGGPASSPAKFASWTTESEYHLNWANRALDEVKKWKTKRKSLEARLLLP